MLAGRTSYGARLCGTMLVCVAEATVLGLGGCGNGSDKQESPGPLDPSPPRDPLSVNGYRLWDRGAGRDLVWASVSLMDNAGDWVTSRTLDDFEIVETLLDATGTPVAGPAPVELPEPNDSSAYHFHGPGFWERTVSDEKLDILFIVDSTGTMSDEMPGIQAELHELVDRLEVQRVDFRMAAIQDGAHPGAQRLLPSTANVPFPFNGVMEAQEIHGWIENALGTSGEGWNPTAGYDSLMTATQFDWRQDADVRKVIVIITDTLPQSVYGTTWHLDTTAANRAAAEIALAGRGFEVLYSQPPYPGPMQHPGMDRYTHPEFNPKAGCQQAGEIWDCGFARLGLPLSWPFEQEEISLEGDRSLASSEYFFAWRSKIAGSSTPPDHTVRITIRTDHPDGPDAIERSFEYAAVLETTESRLHLSDVHGAAVTEDVSVDIFAEMGDRRVRYDWASQNTSTPGEILYTLLPTGDYHLWVSFGHGAPGYPVLYYQGQDFVTVPSGGFTRGLQLDPGAADIELAKARGLIRDLERWGVTDKHFKDFARAADAWLDSLESNGVDWADLVRIKRFYVALSGYVNASGYAAVEARRAVEDFEQVLLRFRDVVERVRGLSDDSDLMLGISLAEAAARLDLPAALEIISARGSVEALKELAEEELVPLLIHEVVQLIPAGTLRDLLETMITNLILGHWDNGFDLLETIGHLALNQALDEVRGHVIDEVTDELFSNLGVPADAQAAIPFVKQLVTAFANNGYDGAAQQADGIIEQLLARAGSPEQASAWVDEVFFALHDELAGGAVRDFVLPMLQLIVRSAIEEQQIDDDAIIGVLAHFFTHQMIVKPHYGAPTAAHLYEALSRAQSFTPVVVDNDWWIVSREMDHDFDDFRVGYFARDGFDGMAVLNEDAWAALSAQDSIDDMSSVLDTLAHIADAVLYPLFGSLCGLGYPTCAMMDDVRDFTAALDAIGLMTKVVELSLKTGDLVELEGDVAFINDVLLEAN